MSTPLASTDPKDILNAARCFLQCVPTGYYLSMRTHLLTKVVVAAQPPCVTPSTPIATIIAPTKNSMKVKILQPANPGSLITTYTVKLGTVSGGPYQFTQTTGAGSKIVTFSGLASGTTYFAVVIANSPAGCSSATSAEASATTGGAVLCNDGGVTTSWAARVVANGGAAPSAGTQSAVCAFVAGAIADGFWNDLLIVNIFAPDNFIACLTPLKVGPGIDPWTNYLGNFLAADLSVNGLQGGVNQTGANRKVLNATGVADSLVFASGSNCGMTIYDAVRGGLAAAHFGACLNAGATSGLILSPRVTSGNCYNAALNTLVYADQGVGYYSVNRTAANSTTIYFASSGSPHASIGTTADVTVSAFTTYVLAVFDLQQGGNPFGFNTGDTFSYVSFHNGLTSAKSANQFTRVQALRTALNGGFV